ADPRRGRVPRAAATARGGTLAGRRSVAPGLPDVLPGPRRAGLVVSRRGGTGQRGTGAAGLLVPGRSPRFARSGRTGPGLAGAQATRRPRGRRFDAALHAAALAPGPRRRGRRSTRTAVDAAFAALAAVRRVGRHR